MSTFVIGFAVSETGVRFQSHNPRGRRDLASGQALPGHEAIADALETEVDWDAEFEADLDDLEAMIQAVVTRVVGLPGTLDEPTDADP